MQAKWRWREFDNVFVRVCVSVHVRAPIFACVRRFVCANKQSRRWSYLKLWTIVSIVSNYGVHFHLTTPRRVSVTLVF